MEEKQAKKQESFRSRAQELRQNAQKFREEFRNQITVSLSAAFGLLIALSWQNTIKLYVDSLIQKIEIPQDPVFYNFYASLLVTFISVLALMWISRWKSRTVQPPAAK